MKVMLIGKEHRSGTAKKTGKDYNLTFAHVAFNKNGCDGQAVETIALDATTYPAAALKVGDVYEVDRDNRGYVIAFEKA